LEKSDKFSKIPSSDDLCQNEFSWVHLDVRFQVTKQVPNGLVRIKETSLNLKFNPYNILWTVKLAKISFKLPNYIVSYYSGIVEHCSSYNDARGVTGGSTGTTTCCWGRRAVVMRQRLIGPFELKFDRLNTNSVV
jgi:hypothetical protein